MNIPNAISLFRISLVPVFAALYCAGKTEAAMAVLLLSGMSDVLDGALARRLNMVTDLGKILDPVADKLMQTAMMLCAVRVCRGVWILLALHVMRESVLAVMGLQVIRETGRVCSAKWYGKLCTFAIYGAMLLILAFPRIGAQYHYGAVSLCALLMLYCLLMYAGGFLALLGEKGKRRGL